MSRIGRELDRLWREPVMFKALRVAAWAAPRNALGNILVRDLYTACAKYSGAQLRAEAPELMQRAKAVQRQLESDGKRLDGNGE